MTSDQHKVFLCLFFLLFFYKGESQQALHFDRIGRIEGLSQSSVNCMLRDRDGFMWFGTQDGLNLYDGKKFRVFQNQPGDSTSLSNNYIVSICEDEEGLIWVGTMTGGLNRFDKRTENFRTFLHSDSVNSISENTVWTVIPDGEGNIWAGTSLGVNRYNKRTGTFTNFRPVPGDTESLITDLTVSLFQDKEGNIWVGTVEGLCLFNSRNANFRRYYNPAEAEMKGANIIWSIAETPGGRIITGTDNGVYLLELSSSVFTRILGSPTEQQMVAWSITAPDDGQIWTGTDRGLFCFNPADSSIHPYLNDPVNPASLADNNVWCLMPDPAGFLWIGTNNGICKARTTEPDFKLLSDADSGFPGLSSSKVMAILEDRSGYLWIGTNEGGLNRISPGGQQITVYNAENSGLRNDNVWALAEDAGGDIYIGNYQGGLHRFERKTGIIHPYPINEDDQYSLPNRRVLALLAASDGSIWIGTRGSGLCRLDPRTGKFVTYRPIENDHSGFPSLTVLSLAEDPSGRIWAGTQEGGMALYLPETDSFKTFVHRQNDENSISDNNVWAITFDRQGRMWAGTQGGLNVAENPGETMDFRYFTIKDGLRSNIVIGVLDDPEGNIWLSTFSGIAKLDIKGFELKEKNTKDDEFFTLFHPLFVLFDQDHGLQGLEFNQGSYHKGKSGTLYFGGNNGLNYFKADKVKPSSYMPPIQITGMKIFNRELAIDASGQDDQSHYKRVLHDGSTYFLNKKITFIDKVSLTFRESVFSFEFASLDYAHPHKNQYAYKMEGFDEHWNFMGTQNTATYTNLDPGNYILLFRGTNSDGIWNPEERILGITIIPPVWKTRWFIIFTVTIAILITFLLIRSLFIFQRNKSIREKEMIELQLKTIKSQIDPHFAFNAINTIASFIFTDKPDVTYDYFTRFARMIRNILEDNEKISKLLSEEVNFVQNYLELQKMRFRDKFDYTIEVDEQIPADTQVPKMIIQSYAENAIKHGLMHRTSGGLLTVSVKREDHDLILVIEDNGIGREKAARLNPDSTHRGFRIMERTLELYCRLYSTRISQEILDLKDAEGNATGTRVILKISLQEKGSSKRKFNISKIFFKNGKG